MIPDAIFLSGGSEIVTIGVVEDLLSNHLTPGIIVLGAESLLSNIGSAVLLASVSWPPKKNDDTLGQVISILDRWIGDDKDKVPIFATEDGGFRFICEHKSQLEQYCVINGSERLVFSGLDKAEMYAEPLSTEYEATLAKTRVVSELDEVFAVLPEFPSGAVIKPALKPHSMVLDGMESKVFFVNTKMEQNIIRDSLSAAWHISNNWLVQERLVSPIEGEQSIWAVRDQHGAIECIGARNTMKYPEAGGTGCVVVSCSEVDNELRKKTEIILAEISLVGMCELEFLRNKSGGWKLLELNARPWLQVGLAHKSNFPIASLAVHALNRKKLEVDSNRFVDKSWVNIERVIFSTLTPLRKISLRKLIVAIKSVMTADYIAVYGSNLQGVRALWLKKLVRKICNFRPDEA